jgi:HK97 family phage major capsid protein
MPSLIERSRELRQDRARLITENRALLDLADAEKRQQTAEEREQYDRRFAAIEELREQIERVERQNSLEGSLSADAPVVRPEFAAATEQARDEVRAYQVGHVRGERKYTIDPNGATESAEYRRAFAANLLHPQDRTAAESRALQMDVNEAGGFTVAPQQFVANLIQAVDNLLFFRGLATVSQLLGAHSIGRPSLDTDPDDSDWTSELATGNEDSAMAFGKRELSPHPLAKRIKISRKLLRNSTIGPEAVIQARLAYKMAVPQERSYMTGSGVQQPLGIFTAHASGISTGRDVSTDNATTAVTLDGLKNAKWTLKGQYWPRAQWIAHRDFGKQVDKIKDGEGRYIWQDSVVPGQPDRLLGFPVNFSEYAPNTFTTGQYVATLGDYSNYWIVESLSMEIQRLNELYAATNQVGYITRSELDGMPVLEEAFVRVKLA